MKRRTLITGSIWSGLLTITTSVRAAFAPDPKKQPIKITPYDAIQIVYDEFEPVDPVSEIEFDMTKHIDVPTNSLNHVRCKLVAKASDYNKYQNMWLVFHESTDTTLEFVKKSRSLQLLDVISKEAHQAISSEEYDEEKNLRQFWSQGNLVAEVRGLHYSDRVTYHTTTTGFFFSAQETTQNNPKLIALSRFLNLLTR